MLLALHGILQLVPLLGFELTPDRYPLITDVLTIALRRHSPGVYTYSHTFRAC